MERGEEGCGPAETLDTTHRTSHNRSRHVTSRHVTSQYVKTKNSVPISRVLCLLSMERGEELCGPAEALDTTHRTSHNRSRHVTSQYVKTKDSVHPED
jgi:hypothetical protein